jgi:hypothetical protein
MVTSGTFFNASCRFDYGNAETDNHDDGAGTMEAVYFGNWTSQGKGGGAGPWVMADMENGVYAQASFAANAADPSQTSPYVTAMVIGRSKELPSARSRVRRPSGGTSRPGPGLARSRGHS